MAHDYAYGIRLDSEGSPTLLSAISTNVRILPEVSAKQRARPSVVANRDGSVLASPTFYDSFNFVLQVDLDYGTPEDPDTVYSNLSTLLQRINHYGERVWLTRTAPDYGDIEIPIVVLREPKTSNPRHRILVPCRALDPFWRDRAVTFAAVNPVAGVTTGGSAPISDAVLVFSGAAASAVLAHTSSPDSDEITITANTTVNAVTVDVADGSVIQSGSPADGVMTADKPWLLRLLPDQANTFTLSSGSCTLTARDKWL